MPRCTRAGMSWRGEAEFRGVHAQAYISLERLNAEVYAHRRVSLERLNPEVYAHLRVLARRG